MESITVGLRRSAFPSSESTISTIGSTSGGASGCGSVDAAVDFSGAGLDA